jgi:predicted aspartyl protease
VVTERGVPTVRIRIGPRTWPATIDTGFNGDLELPFSAREHVTAAFVGLVRSRLADGRLIEEAGFALDIRFDGQVVPVETTFSPVGQALIGTRLLRRHRLEVDFVRRSVSLQRAS